MGKNQKWAAKDEGLRCGSRNLFGGLTGVSVLVGIIGVIIFAVHHGKQCCEWACGDLYPSCNSVVTNIVIGICLAAVGFICSCVWCCGVCVCCCFQEPDGGSYGSSPPHVVGQPVPQPYGYPASNGWGQDYQSWNGQQDQGWNAYYTDSGKGWNGQGKGMGGPSWGEKGPYGGKGGKKTKGYAQPASDGNLYEQPSSGGKGKPSWPARNASH